VAAPLRTAGGITASKWSGVPLYCVVLLQGMPLGRELDSTRSSLDQDIQQQLVDRVTTVGATQSLLPAIVWLIVYGLAFFAITRRGARSDIRRIARGQWPLLALAGLGLMSALWSPYSSKVLASAFHVAGVTLVAAAAASRFHADPRGFLQLLCGAFGLNLLMHLGCVLVAPSIGVAADDRWMGMATHSNTLGGYAFLAIWTSVVAIAYARGGLRLPLGCLAVGLVVLVGSGSSTSMMSALLFVGLWSFIRATARLGVSMRQLANVALVGTLAMACVGLVAYPSIVEALTGALGKSTTFTGRDTIWEEAIRLIGMHPWLGWGFDDNARVIVETGFIHTGYHNGFLDLAVRGGALALIFAGTSFFLMARGLRHSPRNWRAVALPWLVAFLVYNLMEVALFTPRSSVWLLMSFAMFATALFDRSRGHQWD
jgi:exopolysaccharide production protein ExoQ